jgi:hypothetical protein
LRVLDDLIHSLRLLGLVDVLLILVDAISHNLINLVIVSVMDSGLVENIVQPVEIIWSLLWSNVNLGVSKTGDEAILFQNLCFVDFISCV